jgi:hypothetical protein
MEALNNKSKDILVLAFLKTGYGTYKLSWYILWQNHWNEVL